MASLQAVIQQRQKEGKALKIFLLISLVGSLAFHAGVMALKVDNLWSNVPATQEDEEMEVVVEEAPPEQPLQEEIAEIEPPDVPEAVAFAPEVAPLPLAPESPAPLAKGEDAPSNKPVTAPESAQPITNNAGDTGLKVSGGPIFKPFGTGFGFGNANRPTGFSPLGQPDSNPQGKPGGTPSGVPGGTATRTTAPPVPPVSAPKPNQPTCVSCPKPKYRGSEGAPRVEMQIQPDGSVQVRLRKSSGNPETDRETLETMSKWRFDPQSIPEGGVRKRVRVTYEEEGSNAQQQNEKRRRQEAEQRQLAEQKQQRREAQERQRQQPVTAVETPVKPAPSSPVSAPPTEKPVTSPVELMPVLPVEPSPAAVEAIPPEPATAPDPAPLETTPPQSPGE